MKINKLIENILSLTTIKGLEYLLAFITFPYLTRVLQVEMFGAVVFAQGVINYFTLFTDYGFNLLGPKEIAQNDDITKRGKVFANIFFAKILLLAIATIVFLISVFILAKYFNADICLYAVVYITVIGNVIFPVWFFQGVQQMRYITIVNIIARLFSIAGIFYFVKQPQDYLLAALFQAIVPLIAGICSWIILIKNFPEVLCLPKLKDLKNTLTDGWSIFISTVAINLYTASNIVFLGIFTNPVTVGYFSGAQKIIDNVKQLLGPISQAIYPHISKLVKESPQNVKPFLRKVILVLGGGNLLLSIFIFIFAEPIVDILLGSGYEESVILLRIMAFLPFIIALSNVFGIQIMLPFGMQSAFSKILICAAVLNTCMVIPLILLYQEIGVSGSIVITECFVTAVMFFVLKKNKIWS